MLADGLAVAADIAVLAARDDDDRVALTGVLHPSVHMRVDADDAAWAEEVPGAVAEAKLDLPLMDEVRLLLLFVEVESGLVPGGRTTALIPNAVTSSSRRILRNP